MSPSFLSRFPIVVCLIICAGLLLAPWIGAQNLGSIIGLVTDKTGGVIASADVKVTNQETSLARTAQANESGNYVVSGLIPGTYTVEVSARGFKTFRQTDVVLNIRDTVRVDVQLDVGQVAEMIEVTEQVVNLQTETAHVGETVTGTQVVALSMNARNFLSLAALVPGASSVQPAFNIPVGVSSSAAISFNGLRTSHNVWRVDGQENYDRGCGGCVAVLPSIDAIAEFKVSTANSEVDTGFGAAGQVNVSIKSGTTRFHGAAYEFLRNNKLDAANFFANLAGQPKPHLRFNNFGYNIGGPVMIPGLYRKENPRTFFFWSHEWRRLRQGRQFFVPAISAELRQGDFRSYPRPIIDPTTGQQFPGNRIPSQRIDENAKILADPNLIFPLPTTATGFFAKSASTPTGVHEEILRVDHSISDRHQVFFRFILDTVAQNFATTQWTGSTYPTVGTLFNNPPKAFHWQVTSTITPKTINEASFNFLSQPLTLTPTGTFRRPSNLRIPELFPDNRADRMPNLFLSGPALSVNVDFGSWPWDNLLHTYILRDNLTMVRSNHTITAGGQFMPYAKRQDLFGPTQGSFVFNGSVTAGGRPTREAGHEFADFLLGKAFQYTELSEQYAPNYLTRRGSVWINDSWRVSSRLTVNLGLKWDAMPHAFEEKNRVASFYIDRFNAARMPQVDARGRIVPDTGDLLNGIGVAGRDGIPRGLVRNYWDLFQPRIGIAWRPMGDDTVFRIGYGLFTEGIQGNDIYNVAPNPPFATTATIFDADLSNPGGGQRAIFPSNLTVYDFNYKMPQVQQYNAGVQRRLTSGVVLTAAYVGTKASNLQSVRNINQPFPSGAAQVLAGANVNQARPFRGFANINQYFNGTNSNYNAMQIGLRTDRFHGLTLQTSYTWSHAIDYTSGDVGGNKHQDAYNIRLERSHSDFDRRQMLVIGYVYDLPSARRSWPVVRTLLGGWQISGITAFQSGTYINVTLPGDNAGVGGTFYRPDVLRDPNIGGGPRERYFEPEAFAAPPRGSFGNAARNLVRGGGVNNWDVSLFKNFSPLFGSESMNLQFRAEFYNAFNHTQWNGYLTAFGAVGFGSANSARDARSIQLGLKLYF